ncbi:MAG: metal ABC transporter permease [Candidatus Omnitrophica bacterium]|nr:metal ABC transporter permease [Candidatus Omnitrophota bacterium]
MTGFWELMARPFVACLILTGIHAYLGLHVIERGVIFVDLALAQVAAFGATVGFLWGFGLHSTAGYFVSLAFTLLGAAVFALTRLRKPVVPQEALIGVVYAVAAAASILVLSRAAEGGEELKALLVGHLLFVEWPEVVKILLLYSVIGLAHWLARRPLLAISQDPEGAFARGLRVRWWDFLFYATFGFVVTSSVEMAGVLLVFSFLIVPAVCGVLLARTVGQRLLVGWAVGILTSVGGVTGSYVWDLPTGATVVCAFGVSLAVCAALRRW